MKNKGEKKMKKKVKKENWRWVIVGNDKYGLYYGRIKARDSFESAKLTAGEFNEP